MKTLKDNWKGAYWVSCGEESADGGSGFNSEEYGPFFTPNEAYAVAWRLRRANYYGPRKSEEPIIVVEVWISNTDDAPEKGEAGCPSAHGFKRWEVGCTM